MQRYDKSKTEQICRFAFMKKNKASQQITSERKVESRKKRSEESASKRKTKTKRFQINQEQT